MSRDHVWDPRGDPEGAARAAHGHEDKPHLPVRVQTGELWLVDSRSRDLSAHLWLVQAESKLAVVEKQRSKLKEQIPAEKLAKSRKFRLIEKELDKVGCQNTKIFFTS